MNYRRDRAHSPRIGPSTQSGSTRRINLAQTKSSQAFRYSNVKALTRLRPRKMKMSKTTYVIFVILATMMTLSVTVFRDGKGSATPRQDARRTTVPIYDREERYPVVDSDEPEPTDPVKKAKLKKQQARYEKDAPFGHPGPKDLEVAFLPEMQFDFPALPVSKSDVIVIAEVLNAEPHHSDENR